MQAFMNQERFRHTTRQYNAEDVVKLQGTVIQSYASTTQATKLYSMLRQLQAQGKCSHTFGALDTIQVVQMA
ncbi:hypothetical protein AaE_001105, partial [Aphanomyces astaci]